MVKPPTIVLTLLIPYMAQVSRMAGGGKPSLGWYWDEILYGLSWLVFWPVLGLWALLSVLGGGLGKRAGTSPFLDAGHDQNPNNKKSIFVYLLKPLKGKISDYWYDIIGISLVGFIEYVFTAILLLYFHHTAAGIFALGYGLIYKGSAYAIGWAIIPDYEGTIFGRKVLSTEISEYLSGGFSAIGIVIINSLI